MSERVTLDRLRSLVKMIEQELKWAGAIGWGDRMHLDEGSKTYGRAFRLNRIREGETGHTDSPLYLGMGYLGSTRREAWLSLIGLLRGLECARNFADTVEDTRSGIGSKVVDLDEVNA